MKAEDIIYMLIGFATFYVWGHFFAIQFTKTWKKRNTYEKVLTVSAIILLILFVVGSTS